MVSAALWTYYRNMADNTSEPPCPLVAEAAGTPACPPHTGPTDRSGAKQVVSDERERLDALDRLRRRLTLGGATAAVWEERVKRARRSEGERT